VATIPKGSREQQIGNKPLVSSKIAKGGKATPKSKTTGSEAVGDRGAVWSEAANRIAAAACREKPYEEIFRLICVELSKLGGSALFLMSDVAGDLCVLHPQAGTTSLSAEVLNVRTSPIINSVFAANDVLITSKPDAIVRRLFSGTKGPGNHTGHYE
jgi:hypothetical protein